MKIIINETYTIEIDSLNYTVIKYGRSKTGKEKRTVLGYYKNSVSALQGIHSDMITCHDKEVTKISEYIEILEKDVKRLESDIERIGIVLEEKIEKEKNNG